MEVAIQLDEKVVYYTNEDEVSGHVVLRSDTELDIATILFQRNEQIFPPVNCAGWFTSGAVTMPPGEHSFPFSIMFPHVSECYKGSTRDAVHTRSANRQLHHLLRKLPPSSGNFNTPEEIRYSLEAIITQNGLMYRTYRSVEYTILGG
ncbi:hypothetical protein BO85DRAFT_483739 [Aspergillus piperis CBS 112811]|uniref:Arrestin-like N-terminal domain-containing protein n=1 Tax=Aspergillus piperis CBS 112811 TaxID=1448313 RepID=A0A8G1VQ66_9EURO|nr:hypothetical protein BO85DRAFT_483739 [Aspergillus piperis CBS 112811]RAH61714.1 hypothetical protein BO85DRAFT_483739 [Aspergillus piperis CBS 112811]